MILLPKLERLPFNHSLGLFFLLDVIDADCCCCYEPNFRVDGLQATCQYVCLRRRINPALFARCVPLSSIHDSLFINRASPKCNHFAHLHNTTGNIHLIKA